MKNKNFATSAPPRLCEKNYQTQHRIFTITIIITLGAAVLLFASCGMPSPLYGTWADNRGNTVSFFDDNTFNAKLVSPGLQVQNFNGNYTVLKNILTLDCTNVDLRVVTEWDIRGNILYLDWVTAEGGPIALTLFKISN